MEAKKKGFLGRALDVRGQLEKAESNRRKLGVESRCAFCRKRLKRGALHVTRAQVCHHCGREQPQE